MSQDLATDIVHSSLEGILDVFQLFARNLICGAGDVSAATIHFPATGKILLHSSL